MPAVPTAERPPEGLDAYWLGAWRHALKTLKEQGTWAWEQKPLLDEYVLALVASASARNQGADSVWDKHSKRASALADQLALTPRGRKAINLASNDDDEPADPFAEFGQEDELAQRRKAS